MKKFVFVLFCFLLVGIIGCGSRHYLIVGLHLNPVERLTEGETIYPPYRPVTEFENAIAFRVTGEMETVVAANLNLNAGSRCYAWTVGESCDNHLLGETFSMTLDKPFIYAGNIIEANSNILQEPAFADVITIDGEVGYGASMWITFSEAFSESSLFQGEPYTVTFSCKTSDGLSLQAHTTVKFPVKVL